MVAAPTHNWTDAYKRGTVRPAWLVEITPVAGTTHKFRSGEIKHISGSLADARSVASVPPVEQELDPITRATSIGDIQVVFVDDGAIRDLIVSTRLKGKKLVTKLGAHDLDDADFLQTGIWIIDEVGQSAGQITLFCSAAGGIVRDKKLTGDLGFDSPHELLDLLMSDSRLINQPAELYDSASVVGASVEPNKKHYGCQRFTFNFGGGIDFRNSMDNADSHDLIDELVMIMGGSLRAASKDGELTYKPYDGTANSDRDFGSDDIDEFDQLDTWIDLKNRVTVKVGNIGTPGKIFSAPASVVRKDPDSPADHAYPIGGLTEGFFDLEVKLPFCNGIGELYEDLRNTGTPDTTMTVQYAISVGMTGAVVSGGHSKNVYEGALAAYQHPDRQLNGTTKIAWYLLEGLPDSLGNYKREVVKVTDFTVYKAPRGPTLGPHSWYEVKTIGTLGGFLRPHRRPSIGQFTVERAQLGTSAIDWFISAGPPIAPGAGSLNPIPANIGAPGYHVKVTDITMAVDVADRLIARLAKGMPKIRFTVPLENADIEVADFISVINDEFVSLGMDGLSSTDVFEVTRQALHVDGENPHVELEAAWVRSGPLYSPLDAYEDPDEIPRGHVQGLIVVNDLDGKIMLGENGQTFYYDGAL